MNGYQLTKQYFAFAAANPGATTPGMCALFMWLVEVNNRSRFTQNFFFNAEDAGYACGMQSRKTVWKYLVQLEVAGLVRVVYKSNNQERPSVLSLSVESSSGGGSSSLWGSGDSGSSSCYGGESYGEDSSLADDSLAAGRGRMGDASLIDKSNPGLCFDHGALAFPDRIGADGFGNYINQESDLDSSQDINTDGREGESFSPGDRSLYNAGLTDGYDLQSCSAEHQQFVSVARNGELPDNVSSPKNNIVNNTLSVSEGVMNSVLQNPKTGQGTAASASKNHHPKNQSTSPYPSAETTRKPIITPKSNPNLITTKSTTQTTAVHRTAGKKPATATLNRTATPCKAAQRTATATATATNSKMARNTPPPPRRGNTASPALAHSYKGLNNPNQKNSVNGAHMGFGMMKQPDLSEISSFFTEHGYTANAAEKAWAHYRQANWHDVQGRPVLNWQQKCRTIWFTPENRIPTTQTRFVQ